MFQLFNSTVNKLDSYATLVREAKSLNESASFARYVLNSRLCDLLDQHPGNHHLPCDGGIVRKKAEKLLLAVQRRWETRDMKPHVEQSELEQIRAEMVELRKLVSGSSEPSLRVIEGGSK